MPPTSPEQGSPEQGGLERQARAYLALARPVYGRHAEAYVRGQLALRAALPPRERAEGARARLAAARQAAAIESAAVYPLAPGIAALRRHEAEIWGAPAGGGN